MVPSIAAFGIVGLGLGPVVPLAFRTAGRTRRPGHASALPLVVTAGYAGSIVGPLLVGFIADLATLRIAFLVPVVAMRGVGVGRGSDPRSLKRDRSDDRAFDRHVRPLGSGRHDVPVDLPAVDEQRRDPAGDADAACRSEIR